MSNNRVKNRIKNLITAHQALTYLYHSHGDDRGLELAAKFEREAHDLAVAYGITDCPTWELQIMTAE